MGSDIIGDITSEHYPYNETWTSKDIAYYLTPENATVKNCYIGSLSPEYAKNESIKYIAFYSTVPRTTDIEKMEKYCTDFREIFFGKYKVGLVCRINSTAVNSL